MRNYAWLATVLTLVPLMHAQASPTDEVRCLPLSGMVFFPSSPFGPSLHLDLDDRDGWGVRIENLRPDRFVSAHFVIQRGRDIMDCSYQSGSGPGATTFTLSREWPNGKCKPAGWDALRPDNTLLTTTDPAKAFVTCQ